MLPSIHQHEKNVHRFHLLNHLLFTSHSFFLALAEGTFSTPCLLIHLIVSITTNKHEAVYKPASCQGTHFSWDSRREPSLWMLTSTKDPLGRKWYRQTECRFFKCPSITEYVDTSKLLTLKLSSRKSGERKPKEYSQLIPVMNSDGKCLIWHFQAN